MALTETQAELVLSVLYDRVLEYKADNDGQEYDEEIELLQDAADQIDQWIISEGYDD
jgi:hypothetical protein